MAWCHYSCVKILNLQSGLTPVQVYMEIKHSKCLVYVQAYIEIKHSKCLGVRAGVYRD